MKLRWRYGIVAGIFLTIFTLYPQGKLIYNRGWAEWNGHYAYNDIDEVAYASYLRALIDGRPRKNDPYTGRDDSPQTPQAESLFSIQFAGPYTIALPARMLGIPATWAMTISGAVAAFLTCLAIFWLIGSVTGDSLLAMAGTLIVLCFGALFAGEGAIGEILGDGFSYPYFPGFRRYIPAMAFPAFFALIGAVWIAMKQSQDTTTGRRSALEGSLPAFLLLAIGAFTYCVFTYFYVWTAAAAWLGCLFILMVLIRPDGYRRDLKWLVVLGAGCLGALAPYAWLLSKRAQTLDDVQLLVHTHRLNLTKTPELIGFVTLAVIGLAAIMKILRLRERSTILAISLAATPAILFNQQLITGQELQPIHYQVFIGNYVAGLALAVTLGLLWSGMPARERVGSRVIVTGFAAIAVAWGFVECHYTTRVLDDVNIARDEAFPIGRRLRELGREGGDPQNTSIFYMPIAEADDLPTIAPQPVLWARHQHVFADVSWQENKERYYQQLYYTGVSPEELSARIKNGDDIVSLIALFGWGRHSDRLNSAYQPLSFREIDQESANYRSYLNSFDARSPRAVSLSYLVTWADQPDDSFRELDRWYERYDREDIGKYTLYKLRLR